MEVVAAREATLDDASILSGHLICRYMVDVLSQVEVFDLTGKSLRKVELPGKGSAYGFGGIGKIIGPVGLALIVGSNNYLKPDVPLTQIPTAFVYLGCWFLMAGIVYYFIGFETRGKSIEQIDSELADGLDLSTARVRQA